MSYQSTLFGRLHIFAALVRSMAIGTAVTLVYIFFWGSWGRIDVLRQAPSLMVLTPILFIAIALSRITSAWATSVGHFRSQVHARLAYTLLTRPLSILLGLAIAPRAPVMIASEAIANAIQVTIIGHDRGMRIARIVLRRYVPRVSLLRQLRRYYVFTAMDFPSQLLLMAATVVPTILLGSRFGMTWSGYVSLGVSLISLPVQLISLALAPAVLFRVRQATEQQDPAALRFLQGAFLLMSGLGVAGYALLAGIAPWLLPLYLGKEWSVTATIVAWLCPAFALQFLTYPFHSVHRQIGFNPYRLAIDAVFSALALAALSLNAIASQPQQAVRAWAAVLTLHRFADLVLLLAANRRVQAMRRAPPDSAT